MDLSCHLLSHHYWTIHKGNVGLAQRTGSQTRQRNTRRAEVLNPLPRKSPTYITRSLRGQKPGWGGLTRGPQEKKNFILGMLVTFLLNFNMDVPNFCISGKNRCYVFLNVLNFEEFIVHVKVQI